MFMNNIQMGMGNMSSERKKRRTRHKKVTAVQKLYDACRDVFADCGPGVVPPADAVQRLKDILNGMTEHDVGVQPNMPFFKVEETEEFPKITYLHLTDCDKFSIGIFLLPPSGVIPLHNHPQMTVFSKLLFGTMHIKAYDWVDDVASSSTPEAESSESETGTSVISGEAGTSVISGEAGPVSVRLAKLKVNSDFAAPCDTSILYPTDGGNMHCFRAITSCAVLDVLGPPYCDPEGRHCQYYRTHPFTNFAADDKQGTDGKRVADDEKTKDYAWLEEIDKPASLSVVGALYNGPNIVEKE
ncbi:plant cysteine oxidase 2-like isoform X2 [Bidens hawaiensis]|uniref:plant cysteine oxidase 2-like isoform X2 n=1 Tax=Bidens hawaiensis TaxID=980011 RepID=UPI00404B443B